MNDGSETPMNPCFVDLAVQKFESHCELHHRCKSIQIEFDGGKLMLRGQLQSFYLKQLAQEILRDLKVPIDNRIRVVHIEDAAIAAKQKNRD